MFAAEQRERGVEDKDEKKAQKLTDNSHLNYICFRLDDRTELLIFKGILLVLPM